jgi:hypothetical protein
MAKRKEVAHKRIEVPLRNVELFMLPFYYKTALKEITSQAWFLSVTPRAKEYGSSA